MSVVVRIVEGPIAPEPARSDPRSGAKVVFEGIVRGVEEGRAIDALEYEAYRPMADRELERLARDALDRCGLSGIEVTHSVGAVAAGACSFRLVVQAPHRHEALRAVGEFIDAMKRDVPIWKRAVWSADAVQPPIADIVRSG